MVVHGVCKKIRAIEAFWIDTAECWRVHCDMAISSNRNAGDEVAPLCNLCLVDFNFKSSWSVRNLWTQQAAHQGPIEGFLSVNRYIYLLWGPTSACGWIFRLTQANSVVNRFIWSQYVLAMNFFGVLCRCTQMKNSQEIPEWIREHFQRMKWRFERFYEELILIVQSWDHRKLENMDYHSLGHHPSSWYLRASPWWGFDFHRYTFWQN